MIYTYTISVLENPYQQFYVVHIFTIDHNIIVYQWGRQEGARAPVFKTLFLLTPGCLPSQVLDYKVGNTENLGVLITGA